MWGGRGGWSTGGWRGEGGWAVRVVKRGGEGESVEEEGRVRGGEEEWRGEGGEEGGWVREVKKN